MGGSRVVKDLADFLKKCIVFTVILSRQPARLPWTTTTEHQKQRQKGKKRTKEALIAPVLLIDDEEEKQSHRTRYLSQKLPTGLPLFCVFSVFWEISVLWQFLAGVTENCWPRPAECHLISLLPCHWRGGACRASPPTPGGASPVPLLWESYRGYTNSLEIWGGFFWRKIYINI